MSLFFYLFALLAVLGSVGVIANRNPVYAVLSLIFTFLNISGLFILLGAEFIAMTVVIVYVGAVAVLFLFVVMMLGVDRQHAPLCSVPNLFAIAGSAVFAVDMFLIIRSIDGTEKRLDGPTNESNVGQIAQLLYDSFAIPFQTSGVILLVAMVGCIVLTLRKRTGARKQDVFKQLQRESSVELVDIPASIKEQ